MIHLIAAAALAVASSAPCPVASNTAAQAFVAVDIAQEIAVLEVLQEAEVEFAFRVSDLGLTGAAPLFGASRDASGENLPTLVEARETGAARHAASWRAR